MYLDILSLVVQCSLYDTNLNEHFNWFYFLLSVLKLSNFILVTPNDEGTVLFVKNLNFNTTDSDLNEHFCKMGPLVYATVAKKKTSQDENLLSMGYGFVAFKNKADALKALKTLQRKELQDYALELKLSDRSSSSNDSARKKRKEDTEGKQIICTQ